MVSKIKLSHMSYVCVITQCRDRSEVDTSDSHGPPCDIVSRPPIRYRNGYDR